jgi:hypothetical protein
MKRDDQELEEGKALMWTRNQHRNKGMEVNGNKT